MVGASAIQWQQARASDLELTVALKERDAKRAKDRLAEVMKDRMELKEARKKLPVRHMETNRGTAMEKYGEASAVAGGANESEGLWSEDEMIAAAALLDLKTVWVMA